MPAPPSLHETARSPRTRGASRRALRGPARARHRRDAASGSTVTALVAIAIFGVSMAFMFSFATQPIPTSKPDEAVLGSRAEDVLRIIGTSPGFPVAWGEDAQSVSAIQRLGLVEQGKQRTLDVNKFDALAKGKLTTTSGDDRVDYEEAKAALGLDGFDFHLRAYPVFDAFNGVAYGLDDMESWRVAYVGDHTAGAEEDASITESGYLAELNIDFDRRLAEDGGDKMQDTDPYLREYLVPYLGGVPDVEVVTGTLPDQVFRRMGEGELEAGQVSPPPHESHALAVGTMKAGPSYKEDTDHRAVIATVDLSGLAEPTIGFWEVVNGEGKNGTMQVAGAWVYAGDWQDYGVVEARPAGESAWTVLTPADDLHIGRMPSVYNVAGGAAPEVFPPAWSWKTVDFSKCLACVGSTEVELAVRWIADGDNDKGTGWAIDDFLVYDAATAAQEHRTSFEPPTFDALVIGSDVAHNALTDAAVKYTIKDFVEEEGGQLFVFGTAGNTQWMKPLFSVGVAATAGGAFVEDTTHPILSVPNSLDYEAYEHNGNSWEFTSGDEQYFTKVVGEGSAGHVLAVSNTNAFGNAGGQIILTTWSPAQMAEDDAKKLFANGFTHGKYHYLYLETGPAVAAHSAVSSASMTAVMDKTIDGSGSLIEMHLILYLWS